MTTKTTTAPVSAAPARRGPGRPKGSRNKTIRCAACGARRPRGDSEGIEAHSVPVRGGNRYGRAGLPARLVARIVGHVRAGWTLRATARCLGVSQPTVRKYAVMKGLRAA